MASVVTGLQPKMVDLILDSVADGVFTVDADFNITYFNPAAEEITGFSSEEAIGRPCFEIFRTPLCGLDCPLRRSIHTNEKVVNVELDILTSTRQRQTVSVSTAPLVDEAGNFVGGVETFRDLSAVAELRRAVRAQFTFADVVAKNPRMRQLLGTLPNIAQSDATVSIVGAAGTGKELIATTIHNASSRKAGPMVQVSCGSLPSGLIEAELFGAPGNKAAGRIEAAQGGTLLLDDVAELPLPLQGRLLRLLESRELEGRDGAPPTPIDVRIIAATKQNLGERVRQQLFREDLFYRLNVLVLHLPPLDERRDDISHLVEHFVDRLNRRMGRNIKGLTGAAMSMLLGHRFLGNVRELENALEHAFVVTTGTLIGPEDLPPHVRGAPTLGHAQPEAGDEPEDLERNTLVACLERNHWSVPRAARELGMHRTTLWRKLKRHKIERES